MVQNISLSTNRFQSRPPQGNALTFGKASSATIDAFMASDAADTIREQAQTILQNQSTYTKAKLFTFGTAIPLLSTVAWLGGPATGIIFGLPVAFFSGKYSRSLQRKAMIKDMQASLNPDQIRNLWDWMKALQDPKQNAQFDFNTMVNQVAETLKLDRLKLLLPIAKPLRAALGESALAQKLVPVRWLLGKYDLLERLDSSVLRQSRYFKSFNNIFKGLSINMAVANEDKIHKAAAAAVRSWFWFSLGLFGVPLRWGKEGLEAIFKGKPESIDQ
jgi:hypothetical protein